MNTVVIDLTSTEGVIEPPFCICWKPILLEALEKRVRIDGMALVGNSLAEKVTPYLTIPPRKQWNDTTKWWYILEGWVLYFLKDGTKKKIAQKQYGEDELEYKLDCELVVILKGKNDIFTIEAYPIKVLRNRILACAISSKKRKFIRDNHKESEELLAGIKKALEKHVVEDGLEDRAKKFYISCRRNLDFDNDDTHNAILSLSWEWKSREIYQQYPYMCRCWIICTTFFRLIRESK
jgi:hypothetical protein